MQVTEETKQHAQEIVDYILANPEQHDQDNWSSVCQQFDSRPNLDEFNVCDTTMCIAGTSVYLKEGVVALLDLMYEGTERVVTGGGFHGHAERNLGLTQYESNALFLYTTKFYLPHIDNNAVAVDMLRAVASGDEDKFNEVYWEAKNTSERLRREHYDLLAAQQANVNSPF